MGYLERCIMVERGKSAQKSMMLMRGGGIDTI